MRETTPACTHHVLYTPKSSWSHAFFRENLARGRPSQKAAGPALMLYECPVKTKQPGRREARRRFQALITCLTHTSYLARALALRVYAWTIRFLEVGVAAKIFDRDLRAYVFFNHPFHLPSRLSRVFSLSEIRRFLALSWLVGLSSGVVATFGCGDGRTFAPLQSKIFRHP